MDEQITSLPEGVRLPFEANAHNITPFFKHMSILSVPDSEEKGSEVYDLKEVVELRFAGDRNYAPIFGVDEMYRKVGNKVITYAERWAEQYRAFVAGDDQRATGTALEMLIDYGITPAQISLCRALKIYSIEALIALDGHNAKNLGMNYNSLKAMARRWEDDRNVRSSRKASEDVEALKAEIARLSALIPAKQTSPEEIDALKAVADKEFEAMSDDELKSFIKAKVGQAPKGPQSRDALLSTAKALASEAA